MNDRQKFELIAKAWYDFVEGNTIIIIDDVVYDEGDLYDFLEEEGLIDEYCEWIHDEDDGA
jgi:hypothetical protein